MALKSHLGEGDVEGDFAFEGDGEVLEEFQWRFGGGFLVSLKLQPVAEKMSLSGTQPFRLLFCHGCHLRENEGQ